MYTPLGGVQKVSIIVDKYFIPAQRELQKVSIIVDK